MSLAIAVAAVFDALRAPALPAAPAATNPAPLYGRWVRSGLACDTRRSDMTIDRGTITHAEGGVVRSRMKLANAALKSPGAFEIKYEALDGTFVAFALFELKDPQTLQLSDYLLQSDGIWRRC